MYQNKLFCAFASLALILYCLYFRQHLPAIYLIESILLLKSCFGATFNKNTQKLDELITNCNNLSTASKFKLISEIYSIGRKTKLWLRAIVLLNVVTLFYLVMLKYYPEFNDDYQNYYLGLFNQRITSLTLIHNFIFHFLYLLVCFPYITNSYQLNSKVNWSYFKVLSKCCAALQPLKFIQFVLLTGMSIIQLQIVGCIYAIFAFILIYEITIQPKNILDLINKPLLIRLLKHNQNIMCLVLITIIAIEFMGIDEENFTLFSEMKMGQVSAIQKLFLVMFALSLLLGFFCNLLGKVLEIKVEILTSSLLNESLFENLEIAQQVRSRQSRRSTVIELPYLSYQKEEESILQDEQVIPVKSNNIYIAIRLLIAIQQLYVVFTIMRINHDICVVMIIWIFQASITRNIQTVVKYSFLVYIPTIILIITNLLSSNSTNSIILWINLVLIMIIMKYFHYFENDIIYTQIVQEEDTTNKNASTLMFLWALLLRNSYFISLIIVFWISLTTANIIHTTLLVITILFIIKHENSCNVNMVSFRHRNWIWMVCAINLIILFKYVYTLHVQYFSQYKNIVELFGLQFNYNLKLSLGLTDQDFGSISIFWILDIFVVLQYETYKSQAYKLYSKNYTKLVGEVIVFDQIRLIFNVFYQRFILWICYLLITLILVIQCFNMINLMQLLCLFYTFNLSMSDLINRQKSLAAIQSGWSTFLKLVGFSTLFRYLFDFSNLQIIHNQMTKLMFYQYLDDHKQILGLESGRSLFMMGHLVQDIAILCLGYLGQDSLSSLESKLQNEKQDIELSLLSDFKKEQSEKSRDSLIDYDISKHNPTIRFILILLARLFPLVIYIVIILFSVMQMYSITMLTYMSIVFWYIYQLRQSFREQFCNSKIEGRLTQKILRWKQNFIRDVQLNANHSKLIGSDDQTLILKMQAVSDFVRQHSVKYRLSSRKLIVHISIVFFMLTYLSQLLYFIEGMVDDKWLLNIKYFMFVFGTYSELDDQQWLINDLHPYLIALWMVVLDSLCLDYLHFISKQQRQTKPYVLRPQLTQITEQNQYLLENYYYNKYQLLKMNMQICMIHSIERLYLMILFFFAAISEGVFCIIYIMLFATVFYLQQKRSQAIINMISIIIVLLQYTCYIITLSEYSSPKPIPQEFLEQSEYVVINFQNQELLEKLGLNGGLNSKWVFVFNCGIIYSVWLFYYFQEILSTKIIRFIDQCYINYKLLTSNQFKVSSKVYIIMRRLYIIAIIYFPLLVQLIVLLYYTVIRQDQVLLQVVNVFMLVSILVYLIYIEMIQNWKMPHHKSQAQKIFIFYQQCAILIIFFVQFGAKIISTQKSDLSHKVSLTEILTFYILSLGKDLLESQEYEDTLAQFHTSLSIRSQMIGLSMSYEANNRKIEKLIERYRLRSELKSKVDDISQLITDWNNQEEGQFKKHLQSIHIKRSQSQVVNVKPENNTIVIYVYKWIDEHRNRFLFEPSYQIFHYILCQNLNTVNLLEHEIETIQFEYYKQVMEYLDVFYRDAQKYMPFMQAKEDFIEKFQMQWEFWMEKEQDRRLADTKQLQKFWGDLRKAAQLQFKEIELEEIIGQQQVTWARFLLIFTQFLFTFWHYICFVLFILYNFKNHGVLSIGLPFLVFAYGSIEEQQPSKYVWISTYIYISIQSVLGLVLESHLANEQEWISTMFGQQFMVYQYIIIVCITIQVNIMKNIGLYEKIISETESIYQGILRHLFNGTHNQAKFGRTKTQLVRSKSEENLQKQSTVKQAQQLSQSMRQTYSVLSRMEQEFFEHFQKYKLDQTNFCFRAFSNMKPGKDVYPFIAGCQIIIAIYIFFFYDALSISDIFKYSQFSGHTVLALLLQVVCILVDRYIMQYRPQEDGGDLKDLFFSGGQVNTQQRKPKRYNFNNKTTLIHYHTQQSDQQNVKQSMDEGEQEQQEPKDIRQITEQVALRYKYYLQLILLCIVNYYVFDSIRTDENAQNSLMLVFYLLYCTYFFLSALQIKYGINDLRIRHTLMQGYKFHNFVIFKIYRLTPFLFELRTLCDWAFSETSLTLFQWIKLDEIHSLLFMAKCNAYYLQNKKVGKLIPLYNKCSLGFCLILVLLGLLFGPLLLYSPLNPTLENDELIGANVEIGLKIQQSNYYSLYINSHVMDIHLVTDEEWKQQNLSQYSFLDRIERDSIYKIKLSPFSDNIWSISESSLENLQSSLSIVSNDSLNQISVLSTQRFIRQHTDQTQQYTAAPYHLNNSTTSSLTQLITQCNRNTPLVLQNFYHNFIRIDKNKMINILDNQLMQSVYLHLNCTNEYRKSWQICSDQTCSTGMKYYVVSDKYSSALFGYSILGFYLTIVYVAGKMARSIMSGGVELIILQDMPYPDDLLKICEAIIVARVEKDFIQEDLLYFQLLDLIRSPQLMKHISGSNLDQRVNQLKSDQQ